MGKCFPFSLISFQVFSSCCRLHEIIIVLSSRVSPQTVKHLISSSRMPALERDGAQAERKRRQARPAIIPSGYFCRQMAFRVSNSSQNLFTLPLKVAAYPSLFVAWRFTK